ncbi:MAG: sulfatase [Bryobacteraceae bacterium]|nr:sulfatase [Bryobacteraceae bacterium]
MLSRRTALGALLAPAWSVRAAEPKRNVLFIASDDLNTCLSCYGHPRVKTPNIDRIARMGVRFDRAYTQFPLCSPSRTSLMTGLAPDTTTVYDLQKHFRKVIPDIVTLPQMFRNNGYHAARVGKIYHYGVPGDIGTSGLDDAPSWDEVINPKGIDKTDEEKLLTNHTPARGLGSAICFYASPAKDEQHTDGILARETARLIEANKAKPFFLAAGFYRPHVPWIAPSKYFDLFPIETIRPAEFDEAAEWKQSPEVAYFTRPANWGMTERQQREAIQAYYASIAFLDAQVGIVLDALERSGAAKRTTIVFWSDHGYALGERGQWMKQTLFEQATRVPLLIGGAGVKARGQASGRTVEFLDLYPTLAELAGLKPPAGLHGTSLRPLLDQPRAAWTKPAVSQVRRGPAVMGYSIRDERYRYTSWDGGAKGTELYDYTTDRREVKNRSGDPALAAVEGRLKAELTRIVDQRRRRAG